MTEQHARRAFWASALGWGLDSFDFYLYVYALPSILTTFALSKAAGGLLATYTLAASALGGVAMGTLADRFGRRTMLLVSIVWYAAFTFLCGTAHNYAQLATYRALEGIGFGGEWAVGSVLIAEWAQASRRGRTLGFVQGAWAVGWFAANLAFQAVFAHVAPDPGWRYLFFLGIVPAFAVLFLRRGLHDAPAFAPVRGVTLARIFAPPHAKRTILATLLALSVQSGYYALFTWLPSYLVNERHLAPVTGGTYLYPLIAGAFAGYVSAGFLNDRLGRRTTFVLFAACSALMVPLYLAFVAADWQLLVAGPLLGFFASGIFSGFGPYLSELFTTDVRGAAQGFCYNAGRGIAGFAPFLIGVAAARFPLGIAMTIVAFTAYCIAIVAALLLPETRGTELRASA